MKGFGQWNPANDEKNSACSGIQIQTASGNLLYSIHKKIA